MMMHAYKSTIFNATDTGSTIITTTTCNNTTSTVRIGTASKDGNVTRISAKAIRGFSCSVLRIICFDIPLLFVLSLYAIIAHTEWIGDKYLIPQIQLQKFDYPEKALTYYHRVCTEEDQTTYDTSDLVVDITINDNNNNNTNHLIKRKIDLAVNKLLYHGVTIVPNLISETTATQLRDYIIQQNTNVHRTDFIDVIESDFRYSFGIQVDEHPIIAMALEELLLHHNPTLVSYLEAIMGTDPAVVEFTAISQVYGAMDQYWHQDGA
jgi:hypothetical protein